MAAIRLAQASEHRKYDSWPLFGPYIHIPSMQRPLDHNRVNEMSKYIDIQVRQGKEPYFGTIVLCQLDGKYNVVDGQHRVRALEKHYTETKFAIPIHVHVYGVESEAEMRNVYWVINKGVPLPDFLRDESADEKRVRIFREIHGHMLTNCKMIKNGTTKRPFICITDFVNKLWHSKIWPYISSLSHFIEIFNRVNEDYTRRSLESKWMKDYGVTDGILAKCRENNFYIGADTHQFWMDNLTYLQALPQLRLSLQQLHLPSLR